MKTTQKSTTGYIFIIDGATVYWKSIRKTILALPSKELKYVALSKYEKVLS